MQTDNNITATGPDMATVDLTTSSPNTDLQQSAETSSKAAGGSWYDSLADSVLAGVDYAERTVAEYATAAATQATSYYNEAQQTLAAVGDSIETKGVATTFWNYAAPVRKAAVDNLVAPIIGERAATTLEKSANAFMNAPEGQGFTSAGKVFSGEYAPEIGDFYKAFVGGADTLYHYSFDGLADPFGVTKPQLPFITLLSDAQITATTPVEILFEPLPVAQPVVAATESDEPFTTSSLYQQPISYSYVDAESSWSDSSTTSTEDSQPTPYTAVAYSIPTEDHSNGMVVMTVTESTVQESTTIPVANSPAVVTKNSLAVVSVSSSVEVVVSISPTSEAIETLAAQQQFFATVFAFGGMKDLCTNAEIAQEKNVAPAKDNVTSRRATVVSGQQNSGEFSAKKELAMATKSQILEIAGEAPQISLQVFCQSLSFAASNSSSTTRQIVVHNNQATTGSAFGLAQWLAMGSLQTFAGTSGTEVMAMAYSGLLFISRSKEDNLLRRERDQQILAGEVAKVFYTVSGGSASQEGSDSSHQQDEMQLTGVDSVDADADADDEFLVDSEVEPNITIPTLGNSVVII